MEAAKNIFCLQSGWQKAGTDCPITGKKMRGKFSLRLNLQTAVNQEVKQDSYKLLGR